MASDSISARQKSVAEILSVIRTQDEEVASSLDAFFAPDVREGETPPDFVALQRFVGRAFERLLGELIDADNELYNARTEANSLRDRFRKAFARYRLKVVRLRDGIRHFYPQSSARTLTQGDTPRAPEEVFALAGHMIRWIDRPDVEDEAFPVKNKRDEMVRDLKETREHLERLTTANAAHQLIRQRRKDCFKAFNEGFVYLAGLLENLYGLSGNPRWRRLVRPSRQEKGLLMSVMKRRRAARIAARSARAPDESTDRSND